MIVVKIQCKTCPRFVSPVDSALGFCQACFTERCSIKNDIEWTKDIDFMRCQDCNNFIFLTAYRHFDTQARRWLLVCGICNEKRAPKDRQYRNTQYAYQHKIQ